MSSTCVKHVILSRTASLSLKGRDMDLMGVPLGG